MDKYDFQEILKDNGFNYYQGGGIYYKGAGVGMYTTGPEMRVISRVVTDDSKLKTVCLLHGVNTEPYP